MLALVDVPSAITIWVSALKRIRPPLLNTLPLWAISADCDVSVTLPAPVALIAPASAVLICPSANKVIAPIVVEIS